VASGSSLALSSGAASAWWAAAAVADAAPLTRTSKVIPASLWPGMEQAPVIDLLTVPASSVAFWPGFRSGVLGPPSRDRLWVVWPWLTTSSVTGVPTGTSTTLGTTSISLSTSLNDWGEPSGSWVADAGAGAPPVSSSPTRPRTFPSSIAVTSSTSPSTATATRSASCSKEKVGFSASPLPDDPLEAAMASPSSAIRLRRLTASPALGGWSR
jgi:hypothetical protein